MEEHHMVTRGDRVIAGVSGGADSVCLFFVLTKLQKELGFELVTVHVNHGLRGEAADRDERFVEALCGRYGVPFEVFRVELELIAKNRKQSLEEAGRDVRREVFLKVAKQYGANKIALAHHQNDNAETLLWNLCRGSGLAGLGGIRPVRRAEVSYIRPLLCMTREEIEQFLETMGQSYCTDETNAETDYTRNRLRHLVLPVLEREVNAQSVRHMNEAMRQLSEVREYMETQAWAARNDCTIWNREGVCLVEKECFEKYPRVLQTFVLRGCVERLQGDLTNFRQIHVEELLELFKKQVGKEICLPRGMRARRVYAGVELCVRTFAKRDEGSREAMRAGRDEGSREAMRAGRDEGSREAIRAGRDEGLCEAAWTGGDKNASVLVVPGKTSLPKWGIVVYCELLEKTNSFSIEEIPENIYTKCFDYDIIKRSMHIRGREPGDFITIDEAGHANKLKAWFINEKIPARERAGIPLLACGSDILWIIGYRMSKAYQVSGRTKRVLRVEVQKITEEE